MVNYDLQIFKKLIDQNEEKYQVLMTCSMAKGKLVFDKAGHY